jgi:glycosyltransferase involved in cell wall biosynthesis
MKKQPKLKVCMFPARLPADDNQFINLLVDSLITQGIEIVNFSWRTALFTNYDILHIHWPEYLLSSSRRFFSIVKGLLTVLLIFRLRLNNIPLVWTVHNLEPHEKRTKFYFFIRKFLINTDSFKIYMQRNFPPTIRNSYIPHGHYVDLFQNREIRNIQEKSFTAVSFGQVRPYKNIENLIKHFSSHLGSLVIAGKPITSDYGRNLQDYLSMNNSDFNIHLNMKQLSAEELFDLIVSAEAAIFAYKEIYNSGAVLLALSAPIPVIVTDSSSMRDLQAEVGNEWLQIIPAEFCVLDLQNALKELQVLHASRGQNSPLSELRDWNLIAKRYLQVYKDSKEQFCS